MCNSRIVADKDPAPLDQSGQEIQGNRFGMYGFTIRQAPFDFSCQSGFGRTLYNQQLLSFLKHQIPGKMDETGERPSLLCAPCPGVQRRQRFPFVPFMPDKVL